MTKATGFSGRVLFAGLVVALAAAAMLAPLVRRSSGQAVVAATPAEAGRARAALDSLDAADARHLAAMLVGDVSKLALAEETRRDALEALAGVPGPAIGLLGWTDRARWLERVLAGGNGAGVAGLVDALGDASPPPEMPDRAETAFLLARCAEAAAASDSTDRAALRRVATARYAEATASSLGDEALYALWRLAVDRGDSATAAAWSDSLLRAHRTSLRAPVIRVWRAERALGEGDAAGALAEIAHLSAESLDAGARRLEAEALLARGGMRRALAALEGIVAEHARTREGVEAFRRLEAVAAADTALRLDPTRRLALVAGLARGPEGSAFIDSLRAMHRGGPTAALRRDAGAHLADRLYAARRYEEAEALLVRLLETGAGPHRARLRLTLARVYRNTGRPALMEAPYRSLLDGGGGGSRDRGVGIPEGPRKPRAVERSGGGLPGAAPAIPRPFAPRGGALPPRLRTSSGGGG